MSLLESLKPGSLPLDEMALANAEHLDVCNDTLTRGENSREGSFGSGAEVVVGARSRLVKGPVADVGACALAMSAQDL